uniref:Uncharacterized protein n=1 Tax=Avena sativa TaxID=4498 RepID=A0ACD5VCY1_AVESA
MENNKSIQFSTHTNVLHVPTHFQIPPIQNPAPQTLEQQPIPPNPGIWPPNRQGYDSTSVPSHFNTITGQFLPIHDTYNRQQYFSNGNANPHDQDRNERVQQQGGVSFYADAVLKGPRLEIPLFAGDDPIGWLQQCEKFFDMSGTPFDQWVNIATGHFFGKANVWLQNICIPWQMVNWQQFCQMIADRFTQANAHEAVERLKNIQQHSSVQAYIDNFEECVQLVKRDHPYLQEAFLMSCFIGGLRADIKHDVCGQRPRGILEAYWYAKVYESSAAAKKSYYQSFAPRNRGTLPQANFKFPPKPLHVPAQDRTNTAPAIQERPTRQCWYCKEPWNREHRCKQGRTLHIMQELDDEPEETSEPAQSPPTEQTFHTAPNTPDNAPQKGELMHLSTHATDGTAGTATFSHILVIGGHKAVALVDSGSSNTFMDKNFAIKSNCHMQPATPKKLAIAGGGHLVSNAVIPPLSYTIQGHQFSSSFQVLPLQTYDIILGIDWMYIFSPVTLDLPLRLLTVFSKGKKITLTDHTQPDMASLVNPAGLKKMMTKSVLGYIIQIHALENIAAEPQMPSQPEIVALIQKFQEIFAEPTSLPPARDCDHHIHLTPGAQPPNLRPYRVPHM